jgi:phosphatidylglycerol:prolipoprotein diacylglycerol transferase
VLPFVAIDESKIAPLHPFGVCCAVAFFVWDHVLMRMAARRGFDPTDFRVLTIWLGVFGWGFAWAVDALFYARERGPGAGIGWSSTGAILGATVGGIFWARLVEIKKDGGRWRIRRRGRPHGLLAVAEVILATWPLAHAIGRLGCALVHDHIGKTVPPGTLGSLLAVGFPRSPGDGPHHQLGPIHVFTGGSNVQYDLGLLEMFVLAGLALAFARSWNKPVTMGTYTIASSLAYGSFRFVLDFLRAEDGLGAEPRLAGLTFAQYWSLGVVALGLTVLVRRKWEAKKGAVTAAVAVFAVSLGVLGESPCEAAEPFIDRPMTQHDHVFAGDVGLGLGHLDNGRNGFTSAGLNLEGAFGVTESVELGLRTGLRFGDTDNRGVQADRYGRTLWTETYGTGRDVFANPEFRVRWVFYTGSIAEVGLDGRLYIPFETGTSAGMMIGVPLAFHATRILRIDTGGYVPISFGSPATAAFTVPGYFWFQPSDKLWLGPMAALHFLNNFPNPGARDLHLLLGFGLGYQVSNSVDLKTMLLFPTFDRYPGRDFGAGFGVQFRIGD